MEHRITKSALVFLIPRHVIETHQVIAVCVEESHELVMLSLSIVLVVEDYLAGDDIDFVPGNHSLRPLEHLEVVSLAIGFEDLNSLDLFASAKRVEGVDGRFDYGAGGCPRRVFASQAFFAGGQ